MRAFSLCSLLVRFILSSTWADPLRASHGVDIAHGYHPSSLKLRGGSGVYDGLLQSAPGLGEVSEYLEGLAPLGDTCGDPANVPADITSNQFLDSLNPQSLYELIGSERPESEVGIDTPEFQAQGRNFIKAHTIRGALMFLEDSKFFVPFVKAIFNKFDSNQDGFLSFEDFQELQLCTEPGIELGEKNLTEWEEFLNETEDSLETGMSFFGLYRLYQSTGQDVIQDCQVVFGDKFYDMFPYARWLFDNHTMSNDEDQPACNGYKRWQLEDIDAPLTEDVWDIGDLESCVRPENSFWHEWNWTSFDNRALRDFFFQYSLEAQVKQRPSQGIPYDPPLPYDGKTLLRVPMDPILQFNETQNDFLERSPMPTELWDYFQNKSNYLQYNEPKFASLMTNLDNSSSSEVDHLLSSLFPDEESRRRYNEQGDMYYQIDRNSHSTGADQDNTLVIEGGGHLSRMEMARKYSFGDFDPEVLEKEGVSVTEPLPMCCDGGPWVYERKPNSRRLGLSGKMDPWDPNSPAVFPQDTGSSWMSRKGGGGIQSSFANTDRRMAFKILMAGPDGGGKSSLLFAWKANEALSEAGLMPAPTLLTFNVEEVAYKDLLFFMWDMGGPDHLRPFYPPTMDASDVDAIIFVLDAFRFKRDQEYREITKRELWRFLEGDVRTEETIELEAEMRALQENPSMGTALGQETYEIDFPHGENATKKIYLDKHGNPAKIPEGTSLLLQHVSKLLILANKCEVPGRASLQEIFSGLELERVPDARMLSLESGQSPVSLFDPHVRVPRLVQLQAASAWTGHGVLDGLEWLYHRLEGDAIRSG